MEARYPFTKGKFIMSKIAAASKGNTSLNNLAGIGSNMEVEGLEANIIDHY